MADPRVDNRLENPGVSRVAYVRNEYRNHVSRSRGQRWWASIPFNPLEFVVKGDRYFKAKQLIIRTYEYGIIYRSNDHD